MIIDKHHPHYHDIYAETVKRSGRLSKYLALGDECGDSYFASSAISRFCSARCRVAANRAKKPKTAHTIHCGQCGATFEAKRKDARFCSPRCRVAASREHLNEQKRKRRNVP